MWIRRIQKKEKKGMEDETKATVAMCQLSRYDEAEEYFNKALERNPSNYVAYFNLAYVYSLRGDLRTAERMQQRGEQLQMQQNGSGK